MRAWIASLMASSLIMTAPAGATDVNIDDAVVVSTVANNQSDATIEAAKSFYRFWNTGEDQFLNAAIAPTFVDHTLPPGRPQGPDGPAFASKTFRAAVPDLGVEIRKLVVAGDYVTVHMDFKGHFTGVFGHTKGQGQPIDFIATDLLKITNGRITDNWHIEDNLTLLAQLGIASVKP